MLVLVWTYFNLSLCACEARTIKCSRQHTYAMARAGSHEVMPVRSFIVPAARRRGTSIGGWSLHASWRGRRDASFGVP